MFLQLATRRRPGRRGAQTRGSTRLQSSEMNREGAAGTRDYLFLTFSRFRHLSANEWSRLKGRGDTAVSGKAEQKTHRLHSQNKNSQKQKPPEPSGSGGLKLTSLSD